jgi:tetratricopeptide (TPR) repeat protein
MSRFNNLEFGDKFRKQSRQQPEAKGEHHYLAEAKTFFEEGQFEQALRSYSKVLEYNPKSPAAWTGQIRMLIELGEYKEAKLWADKALESFPEEAELLAAKAVALARTGDVKAALTFSDAAIEARGDIPYVWLARGDVLLARKERRADYCFERALSFAPRDWFPHWLASRIYFFYKQFSRALKLAQQALALEAAHAVLWIQFGRCQLGLGLVEAASNSFEQARHLDPQCPILETDLSALSENGAWARLRGWCRQLFQK